MLFVVKIRELVIHSILSNCKLSQLVGRKCMEMHNENLETHHPTLLVIKGVFIQVLLDLSVCYLLKPKKSA